MLEKSKLYTIWVYLQAEPLFWLTLTIGAYLVGDYLYKKSKLNPLVDNMKPIFGCDVWEHSYYVDYRNRRPDYLKAFVNELANWEFVASQLD